MTKPAYRVPTMREVEAWVDATEQQSLQSVMKVTPGTAVLMPWQDASACRRPFVAGFDD